MAGKEISQRAHNFISFFYLHLNEPPSDQGTTGEPKSTHSPKAKSQGPWPFPLVYQTGVYQGLGEERGPSALMAVLPRDIWKDREAADKPPRESGSHVSRTNTTRTRVRKKTGPMARHPSSNTSHQGKV